MSSSVRIQSLTKAAKALEQLVEEVDRQGRRDGKVSRLDIVTLGNALDPPEIPHALWAAWNSARTAGDTSVAGVVGRVRAATKLIKKANTDKNATLSMAERRTIKGPAVGVVGALIQERTKLPRVLAKVKALRDDG